MCERLAKGCYMNGERSGVELRLFESGVTSPGHSGPSTPQNDEKCSSKYNSSASLNYWKFSTTANGAWEYNGEQAQRQRVPFLSSHLVNRENTRLVGDFHWLRSLP